jgi:hypothetical protein
LDKLRAAQVRGAERVLAAVAGYYGLPLSVLLGRRRPAEVVQARQVTAYLMRLGLYWPYGVPLTRLNPLTGQPERVLVCQRRRLPYSVIGTQLRRDHSTARHAWTVIAARRRTDQSLQRTLTDLISLLRTPLPTRSSPTDVQSVTMDRKIA